MRVEDLTEFQRRLLIRELQRQRRHEMIAATIVLGSTVLVIMAAVVWRMP